MDDIAITGYVPGAIGRVAEMHARYYAGHWGFGLSFEAQVAAGLAAFLQRLDPARDGFWTLTAQGRVLGSIALDGAHPPDQGAHLRWFIVDEALRGQGQGTRLLAEALGFARTAGHRRVFLWTFRGLDAARRVYEAAGFRLAEEREGEQWGTRVLEQRLVLDLE